MRAAVASGSVVGAGSMVAAVVAGTTEAAGATAIITAAAPAAGGGSSYAGPATSSVVMTGGSVAGDGHVTISYPPLDVPDSPPTPAVLTFEGTGEMAGIPREWQVPVGVTEVAVDVQAAQGGGTYGGFGGRIRA